MNTNEKIIIQMIAERLEDIIEVKSLWGLLHTHTQEKIKELIPDFVLSEFNDENKKDIVRKLRKLAE